MPASATVVIVTRNRREDVLRAVRSAVAQCYRPLEVLVYDDASDDGTADAVEQAFPTVRLVRGAMRVGYIVLRNRGFQDAVGDVVISIDDDAYFTCENTVESTMAHFVANERLAAIALPYVEPNTTDARRLMDAPLPFSLLRSYVGCAHALRRAVVLSLGGYREFFVHQGEERDLAIRLLDRGYEIRYGDTPPIVHTFSPQRDRESISYYGTRNTLLFDMLNVPSPFVLGRLAADAFNLLRYKLSLKAIPSRLWYIAKGLAACVRYLPLRSPASRACYRMYRALPRHGPVAGASNFRDGGMRDRGTRSQAAAIPIVRGHAVEQP